MQPALCVRASGFLNVPSFKVICKVQVRFAVEISVIGGYSRGLRGTKETFSSIQPLRSLDLGGQNVGSHFLPTAVLTAASSISFLCHTCKTAPSFEMLLCELRW